ncbi:histamine N-methyltransferase-like [Glandiceps talaboti]
MTKVYRSYLHGLGEADIKLLIQLTKRYPKISATIIEPTPSMVTDFKENIIKEGSALKDVEFEWKNMTFEEYMESEYNNQCFHCVLLVCVTAYFVDMEQTMKDLYKMLSKTGSLVIINNSEKGVFDAIRQQFPRLCSHFGRKNAPTDKVVTVLNELGASVRVLNMEAVVDITPCLQKDSEIGNLILDIFTHVLNFRETAPEDLVESVLQFLQGPKLLSHRIDKNVYIHNNKDVIIVQSP